MTSLTSFHLFPKLPPEVRDEIWALTLPGPRLMHVAKLNRRPQTLQAGPGRHCSHIPKAPKDHPEGNVAPLSAIQELSLKYTINPCSYGAQQPIALSVCRESRRKAKRHLEFLLNAYLSLEMDYLYMEDSWDGVGQFAEAWMREVSAAGLADRVRNVALGWNLCKMNSSMWVRGDCLKFIRLFPNLERFAFVLKQVPKSAIDMPEPGVAWKLVTTSHFGCSVSEKDQIEKSLIGRKDAEVGEGNGNFKSLRVTWNEISDRKLRAIRMPFARWRPLPPPFQNAICWDENSLLRIWDEECLLRIKET